MFQRKWARPEGVHEIPSLNLGKLTCQSQLTTTVTELLADMTKYLRCHYVLQTNPCISTCCSWGQRIAKQNIVNKSMFVEMFSCLWGRCDVGESGDVMYHRRGRLGKKKEREETLWAAFYVLMILTPCSTLYSGGPSPVWWQQGKERQPKQVA